MTGRPELTRQPRPAGGQGALLGLTLTGGACRMLSAEVLVPVGDHETVGALARRGPGRWPPGEPICAAYLTGLGADGGALSLLTATPARQTAYASDATAELLEDVAFTLNEGVCLTAAATGEPVLVPDLAQDDARSRWPNYTAAVLERGPVRAVFAFPLRCRAASLGVMNLYRRRPGRLTADQWADARAAAGVAVLVLLVALAESRDVAGFGAEGDLDDAVTGQASWWPTAAERMR